MCLLTDVGSISSDGDSGDSDNDTRNKVTFAPDDVDTLLLPQAKQNTFGLAYVPLDRTPVLGGAASLLDPSILSFTEKKKKVLIRGQVDIIICQLIPNIFLDMYYKKRDTVYCKRLYDTIFSHMLCPFILHPFV